MGQVMLGSILEGTDDVAVLDYYFLLFSLSLASENHLQRVIFMGTSSCLYVCGKWLDVGSDTFLKYWE